MKESIWSSRYLEFYDLDLEYLETAVKARKADRQYIQQLLNGQTKATPITITLLSEILDVPPIKLFATPTMAILKEFADRWTSVNGDEYMVRYDSLVKQYALCKRKAGKKSWHIVSGPLIHWCAMRSEAEMEGQAYAREHNLIIEGDLRRGKDKVDDEF